MNFFIHFVLVNSEFNQALADELYQGQESQDNIKHLWEDELKVSGLREYKIKNNTSYLLAGNFADGNSFGFEIPDMTVCDCYTLKEERIQFAVSKKLLKKTERVPDENTGETHIYFYLSDVHPMENPIDGVYILKKDFPKELKR